MPGSPVVFDEADLLPISGLQHLVFCERQCALIHVEQAWRENDLTVSGTLLHQKVDGSGGETRRDIRLIRGVHVRSLTLGLVGRVDAIELERVASAEQNDGAARLQGLQGRWSVVPIEYKRGKPKAEDCDRVQLCAQALCLEEMTGAWIPKGQLYYGRPRRRFDVELDDALRTRTTSLTRRFRELVGSGRTPLALEEPKCKSCSLREICLPSNTGRSASAYVQRESRRKS